VALRFSIKEIVLSEINDRSPKEFGGVNPPKILRAALSKAMFSLLKPNASQL